MCGSLFPAGSKLRSIGLIILVIAVLSGTPTPGECFNRRLKPGRLDSAEKPSHAGKDRIYSLIEQAEISGKFKGPIQYKIEGAEFKIFPPGAENIEPGYFEAYNNGQKIYASDKVYRILDFWAFKYRDNKYIVIGEDSGGAHCCCREYVFFLDSRNELKLIRIFNLGNARIRAGSLREKNNKLYLVTQDDSFAYFHVPFAGTYFFNRYFLIDENEMIEKNSDFRNEFRAEAVRCENELNTIINKKEPAEYGTWINLFVGRTVNYILAGEPAKAYGNLEKFDEYYTMFYASKGLGDVLAEIKQKMR